MTADPDRDSLRAVLMAGGVGAPAAGPVDRAVEVIRRHLGMDVAYVSEFVGDEAVFRAVDAPGLEHLIKPGDTRSLDDIYCRHILAGRLPELIPDTADEPVAQAMPITAAVPIGAHLSVPIVLSDGSTYGMFCCLSAAPNRSLNERDHQTVRAFADLAAYEIERDLTAGRQAREKLERIRRLLGGKGFRVLYQPIVHLAKNEIAGYEALSRFRAEPVRGPEQWFREAAEVGRAVELEVAAIVRALDGLAALPDYQYLTINASPATLESEALSSVLRAHPLPRIALEITEGTAIEDYGRLHGILAPLRAAGLRIAVDDAGAGYASFRHISQLQPDIIKCDMSLTRGVDTDPVLQALVKALVGFAAETGSLLVAEGVETRGELDCLRRLGVGYAQGFYLGRPGAIVRTSPHLRLAG